MKAQIYIQLNKKKEALAAVQKSLEMHPRFDKGWLLLALLHEQENQLNEAIKGYTNFLEITGESNKEVEQHVLGLIFKLKIKGNNTKPVQINKVCIDNALRLFEKKQYQKALDDLDECIKKDSKNNEAKLLKIEILSAINLKNKAAEQLKIWIDQEPKNSLWYKILHLLTQTNFPVKEVIAILLFIEKRHPETILPSLYLADLYTRTKNYKAALKKHHKALAATKNMPLREKIIFQIAFIHYEAKQFKEFKKVIAQARNHTIKYAPLLNLIAYYYTTQEIRLEIASPLIAHALEQDANNPHFLDTQATIYLKQGNSAQALLILEKIAQIVPSDYTVMVHLAQAMHGEGKIDQAIKILEAAHCHARKSQDALESKLLLGQWKSKKQSHIIASAL
jgi:predicted Zn-dependent protease